MELKGYSDLAKLTRGGMATLYRARQDSLDRIVAIKFLSAEFLWDDQSRHFFDQESLVIARLNHPNIIKVIDRGLSANNRPYFVMEYIEGDDLESLLQDDRLAYTVKIQICMQICRALSFAHKNGVVHRDIKPANILIDRMGFVHILDFGIAWLEASGRPQGEEIVGTPDYMSPEQFSDPAAVSPLSDIYSLGVLMYRLFSAALPSERFNDLRAGLGEVPDPLASLILQCLQSDPALRPDSADEVGFRLLKMLGGVHIRPHDRAEATAAIGKQAEKFELLDVMKHDKYGALYLFEDKLRHNLIVVKKRVGSHAGLNQARQLREVSHDHLMRILGSSKKNNTFIVVMPYLTGGSLQERLSRPFTMSRFVRVAMEICSAMQAAHQAGVVHGNLRPSNILFDDQGHVRVTDFGFSKHYSDTMQRDWYQPQSRLDASVQRDLYSAGAIFYHMLTGAPATVRYGLLKVDKGFEAVDDNIQDIVRHMIEMQSVNRLHGFDEVIRRLQAVKPVASKQTPTTSSYRLRFRHLVYAFLAVNALALLLVYLSVPQSSGWVTQVFSLFQ